MNIFKFVALVLVLGGLTIWLGKGIGGVEKENSQEDVLGNSLNAAHDVANFIKK
jgi:hypothetical protein